MLEIFADIMENLTETEKNIREQEKNLTLLQCMIDLLPGDTPAKNMFEKQMMFFADRLEESRKMLEEDEFDLIMQNFKVG